MYHVLQDVIQISLAAIFFGFWLDFGIAKFSKVPKYWFKILQIHFLTKQKRDLQNPKKTKCGFWHPHYYMREKFFF